MGNLPDIVKAIALNNKIDESRDFASMVQASMHERLRKVDRNARSLGVKQAPFMVLIGATMPSVLAEVSFLTHRQEATLLRNTSYRQQIAEALMRGILKYQQSLKTAPKWRGRNRTGERCGNHAPGPVFPSLVSRRRQSRLSNDGCPLERARVRSRTASRAPCDVRLEQP